MKMAKFCQEGAAANLGLMVAGLHLEVVEELKSWAMK